MMGLFYLKGMGQYRNVRNWTETVMFDGQIFAQHSNEVGLGVQSLLIAKVNSSFSTSIQIVNKVS